MIRVNDRKFGGEFAAAAKASGIEQKLKMGKLKVSDEVLRYMADHFAEALTSRHPGYARRLIQMVVAKAELYKVKLRLHYTPEILMETLTLSVAQGITGLWTVPPWEASLFDGLSPIVQVALATLEAVSTGRASPRYLPNWQGASSVDSLPPVQKQVYKHVERSGVITAHALADALEMSHANAATVLLELYHRGLVDREPIRNSEGLHYSWRVRQGGSRK